VSYFSDILSARTLFAITSGLPIESIKDSREAGDIPFAVSTTTVTSDGIQKVTRSSSGLVGALTSYFYSGLTGK
jgi:hypothetical protein